MVSNVTMKCLALTMLGLLEVVRVAGARFKQGDRVKINARVLVKRKKRDGAYGTVLVKSWEGEHYWCCLIDGDTWLRLSHIPQRMLQKSNDKPLTKKHRLRLEAYWKHVDTLTLKKGDRVKITSTMDKKKPDDGKYATVLGGERDLNQLYCIIDGEKESVQIPRHKLLPVQSSPSVRKLSSAKGRKANAVQTESQTKQASSAPAAARKPRAPSDQFARMEKVLYSLSRRYMELDFTKGNFRICFNNEARSLKHPCLGNGNDKQFKNYLQKTEWAKKTSLLTSSAEILVNLIDQRS